MFVVIINFPPIKEGKDAEFREWFAWSNKLFAGSEGLIRRRLLKSPQDGTYVAIVEQVSKESFTAMQSSPGHEQAGERLDALLDGHPTPRFYEVVVE
jgi:heme-degrading monooxygenase HmoA